MKKYKYLLFLLFMLIIPFNVFASDKTFERSKDNLMVPNDIEINDDVVKEILKTPCVDETEKIYDFAHVLKDDEEKEIYKDIKEYIDNTKYDAVIVLTDYLGGFTIDNYTYHFYDYNFFSEEGIIFTIYINNDNVELFMANSGKDNSDVFDVYNVKKINSIMEYIYKNYIVDKKYYDACVDYIKIVDGFYIKSHGNYKVSSDGKLVKDIPWIECTVVSFAITFIIMVILISKYSKVFNKVDNTLKNSLNYNTMLVKCEEDKPSQKK